MKEKNFLRYRINFKFLSLAYVSFLQTSKKKIILLLLLRTKNFHRAEREKERNVIIITSQKKDEKNARRGKPKFVIGLCIFRAETFRRRKEEGMKGERERGKQTRGKVRHGFGSRVVVVESSEPSQNRERAKKSCLAAITRPGAKGSNRKSTEERGVPRSRKLMN